MHYHVLPLSLYSTYTTFSTTQQSLFDSSPNRLHLFWDPLNGYWRCFYGGKQPEREAEHSTYIECGG